MPSPKGSPCFQAWEDVTAIGDQKAVKKIMAWAKKEQEKAETPKSGTSDKDVLAIMQYCGHGASPTVRIVKRCDNGVVVKSIHGFFLVKFNGGVWVGVERMSPGYAPPKEAKK